MNAKLAFSLVFCASLVGCTKGPSSSILENTISKEQGLEITAIGKTYAPDSSRVPIRQAVADKGGNTSVRNVDVAHLEWKEQGYFQRNRDLGQVFTPERDFWLDAIVLRTGPADKAVLANTPGSKVFVQFFEVVGEPQINNNGTPQGTDAKHGFSTNHRCDDFMEGVTYRSTNVITGGIFPNIPPTFDGEQTVNGDAGKLHYMRWKLTGSPIKFETGKQYAFMVGFEEPREGLGFTLANANRASEGAPPAISDAHDPYGGGWSLRREGDGTIPPTMIPGQAAPTDPQRRERLLRESLFATGPDRYTLSPTTDGYPDVDTYRDLDFALEVFWTDPGQDVQ